MIQQLRIDKKTFNDDIEKIDITIHIITDKIETEAKLKFL